MLKTYTWPKYAYRQSDEQRSGRPARHPVVVVGAGPIGLTAALDCARRGLDVLIVDDNDTVSVGSRAVCYAKRPLEVWDRIGRRGDGTPTLGERMAERGVSWKLGRVYFRDEPVYTFDLLPEAHHKMPAMVNLQQYHLEEMLVAACEANPRIDLRWKHRVLSLAQRDDHIVLQVETPDGIFCTEAQWVVACDGANSELRRMVGAGFSGQFFQDRFLIADIVMKRDMPAERRFWFDPPFHRGQSVLLHKQPDDVWRVDFQLGWDTDPEVEKQPERVRERVRAALGEDVEFELEWVSVYQFACRRIDRFRQGRVLFAGDAAHQVSPFGARGANTGVQDVDNLAWKLALVVQGMAPEALLDSYHDERAWAADDNLRASTRSTDFITPKSRASRLYRDAVLGLAKTEPFARPLVNSGRLSTPTPYPRSPLNTPDEAHFAGAMRPGTVCADAPVLVDGRRGWLLEQLGDGFTLLAFGRRPAVDAVRVGDVVARVLHVGSDLIELGGVLSERYDGRPGTTYLIRPDQHVAARWRGFDSADIEPAIARAIGRAE
jgi:3-(3-hydroxy-phenyl)propionate hydroxylase